MSFLFLGKMVTSRSCSDLSQKAMYIFCDNEDVDATLNTQEPQGVEKEEMTHFPSTYRKLSADNAEFYFPSEESGNNNTFFIFLKLFVLFRFLLIDEISKYKSMFSSSIFWDANPIPVISMASVPYH